VRRTALVATLILLASACEGAGGDRLGSASTSTTSAELSTTVIVAPWTTETTAAPWTTLPDPGMPPVLLASALGGLGQIESVCLAVTTEGSLSPSEEVAVGLTDVLELLGISVVSEGCQATLSLALVGSRSSAMYLPASRCWTGIILSGKTTLTVDGQVRAAWPIEVDSSPPTVAHECPAEDSLISWHEWQQQLVGVPFTEMFGDLGWLAANIGFVSTAGYDWDYEWSLSGEQVQMLTSLLIRNPEMACTIQFLALEDADALVPMVPNLIALLDAANCKLWNLEESTCSGLSNCARRSLEEITGQSIHDSQGDWWAWWEQQRP
jgi:hypothetical protein